MFRFLLIAGFASATALCLSQEPSHSSPDPIRIRNVIYDTRAPLPVADRNEAARSVRRDVNGTPARYSFKQVRDIAEEHARAFLQDYGCWRASIQARLVPLPRTQRARQVDVIFRIDEGPRFTLSEIAWTGAREFTENDLEWVMPVHPGDVASRREIGKGLQALNALYASRGYMNFTSVPDIQFDDEHHTLAIRIDLDEGVQFHFGELSLPGLDDVHREMLLTRWQSIRGTVYSREKEEAFFRGVLWPADPKARSSNYLYWSDFISVSRNEKERTVNFLISFSPPPPNVDSP